MLSVEAQTDTAQNATALAGVVQFIANLTQMHAAENPEAAALMKSLTVAAQGQTVTLALNVPQSQFESLIKSRPKAGVRHRAPRHRTE
jgi:hypothetical protein